VPYRLRARAREHGARARGRGCAPPLVPRAAAAHRSDRAAGPQRRAQRLPPPPAHAHRLEHHLEQAHRDHRLARSHRSLVRGAHVGHRSRL